MAPNKQPPGVMAFGGLVLDQDRREVIANGKTHHLTPKECQLLATLVQHPGEILTREFLTYEVWETTFTDDTRTIDVHISWLRKKIEEDSSSPRLIQTVHGVGYMFTDEWKPTG